MFDVSVAIYFWLKPLHDFLSLDVICIKNNFKFVLLCTILVQLDFPKDKAMRIIKAEVKFRSVKFEYIFA